MNTTLTSKHIRITAWPPRARSANHEAESANW